MKGAGSLAASLSMAEKFWWEGTMEGPSGYPSSAKTASFQVGELGDQAGGLSCLSLSFLGAMLPAPHRAQRSTQHAWRVRTN